MAKSVQRRILALVPYYGAGAGAGPSDPELRLDYLKKTVKSLSKFAKVVIVGVNNQPDADEMSKFATVELLNCEPQYIPSTLFRYYQTVIPEDIELIYGTEADQVLHYNPAILEVVEGNDYLSPHRIEQLGSKSQGRDRGPVVKFNRRMWVLPNGMPKPGMFYHTENPNEQYGGAFLASKELFLKVNFEDKASMPVEHATGFNISYTGHNIKTSQWKDFFVEHLSGKEYHDKL